jgi:predicted transcriptional regulator
VIALVVHRLVVHHLANQVAARNLARIDLHEVVAQIELVPLDKFPKVVKSVIHAGFALPRKSAIHPE